MDGAEASRRELRALTEREPIDLARSALAIAREEYPGLDPGVYLRRLDELAEGVQGGLPAGASPERRVGRLNAFLFHEQGFHGNRADYDDPKNSFLNEVLDRRLGLPITLSVLYLEVGRRCGLRVDGVPFPGHFLCKVRLDAVEGGGELIVDPFHRGRLLGVDELKELLARTAGPQVQFDPRFLRPARPREILVRMLQNLRALYAGRSDLPRALSAVDRLLLLLPGDTRLLRQRAALYEKLGGLSAAAADLSAILELDPRARDAGELRARVQRLRERHALLN